MVLDFGVEISGLGFGLGWRWMMNNYNAENIRDFSFDQQILPKLLRGWPEQRHSRHDLHLLLLTRNRHSLLRLRGGRKLERESSPTNHLSLLHLPHVLLHVPHILHKSWDHPETSLSLAASLKVPKIPCHSSRKLTSNWFL